MLSKQNRFHGHNGVRRVYRQGRPVRGADMSLHVLTDPRIRITKAAVVVSKRVHKSAVRRNRIRRRIYEVLRLQLPAITPPAELVLTVYQAELADMPAVELGKQLAVLFKKAGLPHA